MSELKQILQWVAITNRSGQSEILHQFDEKGNQTNIKYMLDLAETGDLHVMIALPVDQRLGEEQPVGNPFIAIDMKSGLINVNGTNWNFMPTRIEAKDVKFRPIWYHSVRKDFATSDRLDMEELGQEITQYKIGWQFTHEKKNYQRIVFFNVKTGIFSLKEKR